MKMDPTIRIADRRRFIEKRTAELNAELETLVAEAKDLDTAERVIKQYSEPVTVAGQVIRAPAAQPDDGEESEPPRELTLPEMVFVILEEAKAAGRKGVEGSEIVTAVRARWKPHFTAENIRPTLWRMADRGRLRKRGKAYYLPISSPEGETEAVGASDRH